MRRAARWFVWLGLLIGLGGPLVVAAAVFGRLTDSLDWRTAFVTLTVNTAPKLAMAGVAAGVVALIAAFFVKRWWAWLVALGAIAVPAATLAGFAGLRAQAARVPPIHDVSTNWDDPVTLSDALMRRRGRDANPVENDPRLDEPWRPAGGAVSESWAATRVADLNRLTCPGARPVPRLVNMYEVQRALQAEGIEVLGVAPWRVEGTWRSRWFRFPDDVAVRMRPGRTDVRSISRYGQSDLGANCARVTRIVRALNAVPPQPSPAPAQAQAQ